MQVLGVKLKTETNNYAPGLGGIREAVADCRMLAQQILQKKGGPAPAAAPAAGGAGPGGRRPAGRAAAGDPGRDLCTGVGGRGEAPADRAA